MQRIVAGEVPIQLPTSGSKTITNINCNGIVTAMEGHGHLDHLETVWGLVLEQRARLPCTMEIKDAAAAWEECFAVWNQPLPEGEGE